MITVPYLSDRIGDSIRPSQTEERRTQHSDGKCRERSLGREVGEPETCLRHSEALVKLTDSAPYVQVIRICCREDL
jgi:hypothetical protein